VLGATLLLGAMAHSFGVCRLYLTRGMPDLNRVLLDVWIAEAQAVGGALFLLGRRRPDSLPWILAAALESGAPHAAVDETVGNRRFDTGHAFGHH
jgi:hypothetical protein